MAIPKRFFQATATLTALGVLAAPAARAEDAPANTVRLGLYAVMYHVKASDISGPFTPSGLNLDIKNVNTLYFGLVRKLSTHFSAELALAIPPLSSTIARGPATVGSVPYNGQVIAKSRWLAPTALIDYQFLDDSSSWRPYVGAGVNYTAFYARHSTPAGDQITGGPTKISMTSSFGPAATMGVLWHPSTHLEVNLSYSIARINSRMTIDTGGILRHTKVQFQPQPLIFSVGYSF
jgi:outer membrane protein